MDNNAPDSAIADSEVHLGESITNRIDAFAARFLKVTRVIEDGVAKVCIPLVKELHGLWTDAKALVNEPDHEHDEHDESVVPSKKFDSHIFQEIFIGAERKEQLRDLDGEFSTHETPEEKDSALRLVVGAGSFGITLFCSLHFVPGLSVLGAAGLVYQVIPIFTDAYHALVDEGRISFYVLNSGLIVMATLSGSFLAVTGSVAGVSLLRWLTAKTEGVAQRSLASVFSKQPRSVYVVHDDVEVEVPFDQVRVGDTVVLRAGDMIPADGVVLNGVASVDQRMLTGEAQPVDRTSGDSVLASTMILQGWIHLRVARSGMDTVAAQVARALTDTSKYKRELKARTEQRLDALSIPFLALSAITLPLWGLNGAAAVLRSSPAYRMMFFGPLTMLSFLHAASRKGILLKNGQALEVLRNVDTFVFDKTGTLTLEQPIAERVFCFADLAEDEVLALVAAAEYRQTHPIALAILDLAKQRGIRLRNAEEVHVSRGFGMIVLVDGQRITLGSERMMSLAEVALGSRALCEQQNVHAQGHSFIFIARDEELVGAIEIRPRIRPEAAKIVAELERLGKKVFILSGDHEAPTASLARQLGVDGYFSQVLPEDKATVIEQMQTEGRTVCFVGDGINDSIALQRADVSISMKGAASIATDVAQIVLMNGNLELLLPLLDMSERFEHYMRVNRLAAGVPAFITLAGTMLLGWGFATAVVLSQLSTPVAIYCLVGPSREYAKRT